jgi:hypothetical protein
MVERITYQDNLVAGQVFTAAAAPATLPGPTEHRTGLSRRSTAQAARF